MTILPPPTTLPIWAVQDVVDPTSGQNNVQTPPDTAQQFGWGFRQFPPRNWFNWLGRWTANWLSYLAQNDPKSRTFITFCNTNGGNSDGPVISLPQTGLRPILMVYVNNPSNDANDEFFIGMATLNSSSSFNVNLIDNYNITVGQINKTTGILDTVETSGTLDPDTAFNIVTIQYDSFF